MTYSHRYLQPQTLMCIHFLESWTLAPFWATAQQHGSHALETRGICWPAFCLQPDCIWNLPSTTAFPRRVCAQRKAARESIAVLSVLIPPTHHESPFDPFHGHTGSWSSELSDCITLQLPTASPGIVYACFYIVQPPHTTLPDVSWGWTT